LLPLIDTGTTAAKLFTQRKRTMDGLRSSSDARKAGHADSITATKRKNRSAQRNERQSLGKDRKRVVIANFLPNRKKALE
jgi:hypothetical protein